ncbi:MAG: hypothetical protein MZU91_06305 [Desulfosudis oleivorans]|nr:hypothetical protein [Desulfosudis oleivorans]
MYGARYNKNAVAQSCSSGVFRKRFVYGVGQEITELKQSWDLLKARDELLKQVIDMLPGAVMISNRQGPVEYLSEGFIRAFGFTP